MEEEIVNGRKLWGERPGGPSMMLTFHQTGLANSYRVECWDSEISMLLKCHRKERCSWSGGACRKCVV